MSEFVAVTFRKQNDERGAEIVEKDGKVYLHIWEDTLVHNVMRGVFDPPSSLCKNKYLPVVRVVSTGIGKEHDDGSVTTICIYEVEDAANFWKDACAVSPMFMGLVEPLHPIID